MFEGDADMRLIPETVRVLRHGGKMVMLPLYMHHLYYADSDPQADRRGLDYQGPRRSGAKTATRYGFLENMMSPPFWNELFGTKDLSGLLYDTWKTKKRWTSPAI
jgi:hypothetical protein